MAIGNPSLLVAATQQSTEAAITSGSLVTTAGQILVVVVDLFTANSAGLTTFAITDTDGAGGHIQTGGWTQVPSHLGTTGNFTLAAMFVAVANGSTGTVTVTPSLTGAANSGMGLQVYTASGSAGLGTSSPNTASTLTVALSSAPAASSLVIAMLVAGQGSDPAIVKPTAMTSLVADRHDGTFAYVTIAYQNGSASQSNSFTGSNANTAAVAIELLTAAPPDAPVLTVTPGNGQNVLTWTTPATHGAAITGYQVLESTTSGGETNLAAPGNVNTYTHTGLTNGTTYFYQVQAIATGVANSASSAEQSGTPALPPLPPLGLSTQSAKRTPKACILSDAPAGSDRIWLDNEAKCSGLVHQTTYPGGDTQATWQMTLDPRAQHRAWAYGRAIQLALGGTRIWNGNLDNPTRGTTWSMTAIGAASKALQYVALAATSGNALNLSEVLTAANTRGLGWTLPGSFPTMSSTASSVPSGSITIGAALDQVCAAQTTETYWSLDRFFNLTFTAAPTTPTRILYATVPGGGRSLSGLVTDAFVMYQSASGVLSVDHRTAASSPFGHFEQTVDQTGLGLIPTSQADALGDGFLARNSSRTKFAGLFTATAGQLTNMGGVAVDPSGERAGFLANVIMTDPDSAGEVALSVIPNVLIGITSYDWDAGVLSLTPTYSALTSLQALLGAGSGT